MPDLSRIIAMVFSGIFIIIILYFLGAALTLMRKDLNFEKRRISQKAMEVEDENGYGEWALKVIQESNNKNLRRGEIIALEDEMTMGRVKDNTIILDDPFISFHQVRFFIHDGRFVIEDLRSTNGTYLNNEPLTHKTYLRKDDLIQMGNTSFIVVN